MLEEIPCTLEWAAIPRSVSGNLKHVGWGDCSDLHIECWEMIDAILAVIARSTWSERRPTRADLGWGGMNDRGGYPVASEEEEAPG